jgi:hypothetical protein
VITIQTPLNPPDRDQQNLLSDRIRAELRRMHIPAHLRGYYYLTHILLQVVPNTGIPLFMTKNLYPDAGRTFGVSASSVERAIRTSISNCWNGKGRDALEQMADYRLPQRPTSSQFIYIMADYIRRTS